MMRYTSAFISAFLCSTALAMYDEEPLSSHGRAEPPGRPNAVPRVDTYDASPLSPTRSRKSDLADDYLASNVDDDKIKKKKNNVMKDLFNRLQKTNPKTGNKQGAPPNPEPQKTNPKTGNKGGAPPNPEPQYGIIFDAGSTGTRGNVYKWNSNKNDTITLIGSEKYNKALHKTETVSQDTAFVAGLALGNFSADLRQKVPLDLLATGGLRSIGNRNAKKRLKSVKNTLKALNLNVEKTEKLPGFKEALFVWLSFNHMKGLLAKEDTNTEAVLEIGGQSLQIAFEVTYIPQNLKSSIHTVTIGNKVHKVFAIMMEYGGNTVDSKLKPRDWPFCYQNGYIKRGMIGNWDFKMCSKALENVVKENEYITEALRYQKNTNNNVVYGFGNTLTHVLNQFGQTYDNKNIENDARGYCEKSVQDATDANEVKKCFQFALMSTVVKQLFGNKITLETAEEDASWSHGAILCKNINCLRE